MASHDAIARLSLSSLHDSEEEYDFACTTFFEKQSHSSLSNFLVHYIHSEGSIEMECEVDEKGKLFQVRSICLHNNAHEAIAKSIDVLYPHKRGLVGSMPKIGLRVYK